MIFGRTFHMQLFYFFIKLNNTDRNTKARGLENLNTMTGGNLKKKTITDK